MGKKSRKRKRELTTIQVEFFYVPMNLRDYGRIVLQQTVQVIPSQNGSK